MRRLAPVCRCLISAGCRCLSQSAAHSPRPACLQEVLLQEELPLQAVLMAASMSRVHTLPLPGNGQVLVEVALSHPRQGGVLLAALGGGSGLRVVDHEGGELMRVAVGGRWRCRRCCCCCCFCCVCVLASPPPACRRRRASRSPP
jgi:hypothetical protein